MISTMDAVNVDAESGHGVQGGADAYGRVLIAAGGKEIEALMRNQDHPGVCAAIYASPPYDLHVPPLPVSRLSVNLTRSHVSGGIDGERDHSFEAGRYSLFFAPAGAPVNWRKDSPSRHLNIYFHPDAFGGGDDDVPSLAGASPVFNIYVPGTRQLADQLAVELDSPGLLNADAADSLARLLVVRLVRHLHRCETAPYPLTPKVLARLRDYVVEHLAERILVADLAREAGLAPNRFALAYSKHTGHSPHQFVLALRIEHAAELLRHSTRSLADVAHACGFANQQHLSNTMRRHLGITPSGYRALQRQEAGTGAETT